jgi:hypothetical protein
MALPRIVCSARHNRWQLAAEWVVESQQRIGIAVQRQERTVNRHEEISYETAS